MDRAERFLKAVEHGYYMKVVCIKFLWPWDFELQSIHRDLIQPFNDLACHSIEFMLATDTHPQLLAAIPHLHPTALQAFNPAVEAHYELLEHVKE